MEYKLIREHIETFLSANIAKESLALKIKPATNTLNFKVDELPIVVIIIKSGKHTDRPGRASLQKSIQIDIMVISSKEKPEDTFLPFLEKFFRRVNSTFLL